MSSTGCAPARVQLGTSSESQLREPPALRPVSYPPAPSRRYPAGVYIEHLHIPVGPGTLHIERVGRGGPAVLLLHGFGQCAFLWRRLAPALASSGFTVIAPDLMGFGESSRSAELPTGPAAQAQALELALTALRLGEVHCVGQDMGALVALLLAAEQPRRVRQVALLEPLDPLDLPGPAIRALQRTTALAAFGANSLFGARPLLETLLRGALASAVDADRVVARYLAPFVGGDGLRDLLQLASAVSLSDEERERLSDVTAPVALWTPGPRDTRMALWQQWLPAAEVRALDTLSEGEVAMAADAGLALVPESAPEALEAAIRRWLAYPE